MTATKQTTINKRRHTNAFCLSGSTVQDFAKIDAWARVMGGQVVAIAHNPKLDQSSQYMVRLSIYRAADDYDLSDYVVDTLRADARTVDKIAINNPEIAREVRELLAEHGLSSAA